MKPLIRWGKFNLVGAMGMGVQLGALALLNRWMAGHYLFASAAAIEITLLHNFVWHLHYTWRDRRDDATWLRQLVRFHLSNGLVSMVGNLVLMRLLVREARMPVLVANGMAIVCCSVVNFCLGDCWAFAGAKGVEALGRRSVVSVQALVLALFMSGAVAHAQMPATPFATVPDVPTPQPTRTAAYHSKPSDTYFYNVGAFCGAGASTSQIATKPTIGCGAGLTLIPLPVFVEVGVMGPQANRSYVSGYISLDSSIPLARPSVKYLPMAIVGYSRLFETGHAFDYGLALALPRFSKRRDDSKSLRVELRDYWTFANPAQHNVMLRVGWMGVESD